jgi:hypothetical protein
MNLEKLATLVVRQLWSEATRGMTAESFDAPTALARIEAALGAPSGTVREPPPMPYEAMDAYPLAAPVLCEYRLFALRLLDDVRRAGLIVPTRGRAG